MSQDISLYLLKNNIPSAMEWNKALRDQDFRIRLNPKFDPLTSEGFISCGKDGFEYYNEAVEQDALDEMELPATECDWVITLCTQDDDSFAAALAVLSSVAQITGGKICDMQDDEVMSPAEALARARELLAPKAKPKSKTSDKTPNHLTNTIKSILLPTLTEHGLRKLNANHFYRIRGRMAQGIRFEKFKHAATWFRASAWYSYLLPHRTSLGLDGVITLAEPKRDRRISSNFISFDTAEEAETSMQAILNDFIEIALPQFESMTTPQDFLNLMSEKVIPDNEAHLLSNLGCSKIDMGDVEQGLAIILKARQAYLNWGTYFIDYLKNMDALIAAVENGTHNTLLETWYQASLRSLKMSDE